MFEDEYKKANDRLHRSSDVDKKVLDAMLESDPSERASRRSFPKGAVAAIAAVLCMLIIAPSVIGITSLAKNQRSNRGTNGSNSIIALAFPDKIFDSSSGSVTAADYSSVYERLNKNLSPYYGGLDEWYLTDGVYVDYEKSLESADIFYGGNEAMPNNNEPTSASEHSETNTQVEGVDEADIVKTDGKHIFVLNTKGVTVLKAAGAETSQLSFIAAEDMPKHHEDARTDFVSMYINGGRLIVIATERVTGSFYDIPENIIEDADEVYRYGCYGWWSGSFVTTVYVYDVENASEPKLLNTLCMDGSYKDSRLTDGKLYLVTDYWPGGMIVYDAPCTYIPCMFDSDGECILTPVEDIYVVDDSDSSARYTYVGALDLNSTDSFSGTLAILGSIQTLYCSRDNMYLAAFGYRSDSRDVMFVNNPETGGVELVEAGGKEGKLYSNSVYTSIYKVKLGSQPVLECTADIEGSLLNQFSMDEYNGYLRVVTDRESYSYVESSFSGDDYNDSVCYSYLEREVKDNALFVLDGELKTVGKIDDIGVNEHVKSVRFMGDVGYVVTFRQTDPLFSIDLSDPVRPVIIGELHIPGFSEYLHSWNDELLFGIGQMADEHTGGVQGLKLSMFDVSNNSDVKELYCQQVRDVDYSAAENNHKMILVSPERGIIGFPSVTYEQTCTCGYYIYTFDKESGFTEKTYIKLDSSDEYMYFEMTGMYIGDYYYIILPSGSYENSEVKVFVVDLNSFEVIESSVFKN